MPAICLQTGETNESRVIHLMAERRTRQTFIGGFLLSLVTSLPIIVFMFAPVLWQQPLFAWPDRWWSLAIMALAPAFGGVLSRLLERHWKSTRNRGRESTSTK